MTRVCPRALLLPATLPTPSIRFPPRRKPTRRGPMELLAVIVLALLGLAAEFERHRALRN